MQLQHPWQEVLSYWFADALENNDWPEQRSRSWFRPGPGDDEEVRLRFAGWVEAALYQELVDWERQPQSRLALILLLDQFTRQLYRGQSAAFAGDHRAATLAVEGVSRKMDQGLPWAGRQFFYMPLMHAEDIDLQAMAVRCFDELCQQAPQQLQSHFASCLHYARDHAAIINRFGRFPHRNQALGRESSPEELAYLENAPRYGQ